MRVEPIKSKKDIEKIKRYLRGHPDKRLYVLFVLGTNTGLRISDIVPLQVKKVYKQEYIKIKDKKTNKCHQIIINDSLKEAIDGYCEGKKRNDYLFPSQKGGHICEDRAYVLLKKVFKRCRIRVNTGTHTLRKTNAYHMKEKYGLEVVQKQLNHESTRDTLRYIGLEQEQLDIAVKGTNL